MLTIYIVFEVLLNFFSQAKSPEGEELAEKFVKMWLDEIDCMFGLHDKKLAVLGLTIFMQLPPALRTPAIQAVAPKLLPAALLLFQVSLFVLFFIISHFLSISSFKELFDWLSGRSTDSFIIHHMTVSIYFALIFASIDYLMVTPLID